MKRVLVAGIGNVLLGDDGVGPFVAQWLSECYSFPAGVAVEDLGTPALDFIDHIAGLDLLIVIDSVENDQSPGTVKVYRKEELMQNASLIRMDTHSPALTESLVAAEVFFGVSPKEVLLIGVTAECYEANCELSASVGRAVPNVVTAVLGELARAGVSYSKKDLETVPAVGWRPVLSTVAR
jgi:hydrogenase maturation protease